MIELILYVFILGFIIIALEHTIKINKTATSLITGILIWTIYITHNNDSNIVNHQLSEHMGEISSILFFLLGAMTIVEVIDAHDGFQLLSDNLRFKKKRLLFFVIGFITFFLSALLDNLTTTIIMISLCKKIIPEKEQRFYFCGMIIIAANSGGVWSPLGDVTTTMLWSGGQISALNTISTLILPSFISLFIPMLILQFKINKTSLESDLAKNIITTSKIEQYLILSLGILILVFVPLFKSITGLPPYMAILLGLGILWAITEIIHYKKELSNKQQLSVATALQKIDTTSILFFLGLLLSVGGLQNTGILNNYAQWCAIHIPNIIHLAGIIGLFSAIVDNVPIVAAVQGMYSLQEFPIDHTFWSLIAYTAGVGGSILIFGSAAGVAAMGLEQINFFWYFKKISLPALIGYISGILCFILLKV